MSGHQADIWKISLKTPLIHQSMLRRVTILPCLPDTVPTQTCHRSSPSSPRPTSIPDSPSSCLPSRRWSRPPLVPIPTNGIVSIVSRWASVRVIFVHLPARPTDDGETNRPWCAVRACIRVPVDSLPRAPGLRALVVVVLERIWVGHSCNLCCCVRKPGWVKLRMCWLAEGIDDDRHYTTSPRTASKSVGRTPLKQRMTEQK